MTADVEEALRYVNGHYKVVCRDCEKVMTQCRCMAPAKKVIYTACGCQTATPAGYGHGV